MFNQVGLVSLRVYGYPLGNYESSMIKGQVSEAQNQDDIRLGAQQFGMNQYDGAGNVMPMGNELIPRNMKVQSIDTNSGNSKRRILTQNMTNKGKFSSKSRSWIWLTPQHSLHRHKDAGPI